MKYIVLILLSVLFTCVLLFAFSCNNSKPLVVPEKIVIHDTVLIAHACNYDSLVHQRDSVIANNDTLAKKLLYAKLQLNNVRYYLNICLKNPSQDKFLKGWIKRALD